MHDDIPNTVFESIDDKLVKVVCDGDGIRFLAKA